MKSTVAKELINQSMLARASTDKMNDVLMMNLLENVDLQYIGGSGKADNQKPFKRSGVRN